LGRHHRRAHGDYWFYGQNVPYPGFCRASGFYASTLIIILFSGLLYWLFKRKDWL